MGRVWAEQEVTLATLAAHMADSGMTAVKGEEGRILLHTESGIGYVIRLDTERKFIRFATYLPLDDEQPDATKREFANALNSDVFLPSFAVDEEGDLRLSYAMPYCRGLIAGQFMHIVHRFGSLLEYLVNARNKAGIIAFGTGADAGEGDAAGRDALPRDKGILLN